MIQSAASAAHSPQHAIGRALKARIRAILSPAPRQRDAAVVVRHLNALSANDLTAALDYIAGTDRRQRHADVALIEVATDRTITREKADRVSASWEPPRRRSMPFARHFVFSLPTVRGDPVSYAAGARALRDAARVFANWGQLAIAGLHHDTDNLHMHLIVHWRGPADRRLLPLGPDGVGLGALRIHLADTARGAGFSVTGLRRKDLDHPERARGELIALLRKYPDSLVSVGGDPAQLLARLSGAARRAPGPGDIMSTSGRDRDPRPTPPPTLRPRSGPPGSIGSPFLPVADRSE